MKVTVDGKPMEGERIDFTPVDEPWSRYRLNDGTVVRLKLVVADIVRLPGSSPEDPQLLVRSSNVMAVESPSTPEDVH